MTTKPLPEFVSPSSGELRVLWRHYADDPAISRLVLEIVRLRRQMAELERLRVAVVAAWADEVGDSHQVGLYKMRRLLQAEIERL